MTEYIYTAITKDGKKESSSILAPSLAVAGHLLKEQGLLPTDIKEKSKDSFLDILSNFSTISLAEKIGFVENLSIMLKAGIAVTRALQILSRQTKNARFKKILLDIHKQVESGQQMAEALGKYPTVFSNIFISMIQIGELSGNLEKSLEYLTIQLQREADLKSKTKGAMIYPAVIMGAMFVIGILMSIFVLPKLTSIFKDFKSDLPFMTKMVIHLADFMSSHAILAVGIIILVISGLVAGYKTYTGKKYFDIFLLHFMVINPIIKKINLARFSRILSSMLKSGIPIVQGLEVSASSMSNIPYRELLTEASKEVRLGKTLTQALNKDEVLFPFLVIQMLEVGEESGTVEEILGQLATHYEEEVDTTLRNLSSIIEPLLLLIIGGVVGVLAVALIAPIYNISSSIN